MNDIAARRTVAPGAGCLRESACVLAGRAQRFTCLLVNAAHLKHVPGRKTDVKDCVWIARVLERGLLRGSFVPTGAASP